LDYSGSGFGTVAETPEFSRRAARLLSPVEQEALVLALAMNPLAGNLIRGTGGVRKLRWARGGRGKSGGTRVIYYFHSDHAPLYLLTIYGKGEKADLTDEERSELATVTGILKQHIEGRQ
jgi:mRNA-degrading endonuclease RelE of RelBE toxin-antitoxin system